MERSLPRGWAVRASFLLLHHCCFSWGPPVRATVRERVQAATWSQSQPCRHAHLRNNGNNKRIKVVASIYWAFNKTTANLRASHGLYLLWSSLLLRCCSNPHFIDEEAEAKKVKPCAQGHFSCPVILPFTLHKERVLKISVAFWSFQRLRDRRGMSGGRGKAESY